MPGFLLLGVASTTGTPYNRLIGSHLLWNNYFHAWTASRIWILLIIEHRRTGRQFARKTLITVVSSTDYSVGTYYPYVVTKGLSPPIHRAQLPLPSYASQSEYSDSDSTTN
jgi:hypothetical protein